MQVLAHYYSVELHNFNPNSVVQAAVFATMSEGYLGTAPIGTSGFTYSRWTCPPRRAELEEFRSP